MARRKLPEGMTTRPGRRGYYAEFVVAGRRVQKKLGNDFGAARSKLRELRARCERGDFGLLDHDFPVAELRAAYLKAARQELRPATLESYEGDLDDVLGWLGAERVRQITKDRVTDYRAARLGRLAAGTINRRVAALHRLLRWGARRGLTGPSPLDGLRPLPDEDRKEGRALTRDEVARLLERSPPHWRDVWYAFLVTGLRRKELAGLRFADVDWANRELVVRGRHAKGKRERRLPIDDGLWEVLCRRRDQAAARQPGTCSRKETAARVRELFTREHVFTTTQNTPLTARSTLYMRFMACLRRAGVEAKTYGPDGRLVEHVDVHSLRRTFATDLIENGADPKTVQELLGHKTLKMTMEVYARVRGGTKRQAIGRLSYAAGGATPPGHVLPAPAAVPATTRAAT